MKRTFAMMIEDLIIALRQVAIDAQRFPRLRPLAIPAADLFETLHRWYFYLVMVRQYKDDGK